MARPRVAGVVMALTLLATIAGAGPCLLLTTSVRAAPPSGEDFRWTGWRGPNRDGWVGKYAPPAKWPKDLEKVWRVTVGTGYGCPLVLGGRVYQHARRGDDEVVWCLDLNTGEVIWRKAYATPFKAAGGGEYHGNGPKSCPVLSDGRLLTMSIMGVLTAWDAETGKRLWEFDPGSRFKKGHPRWGAATSPIVDGGRIIAHFGTDFDGALIALDTATGKEVWSQGKDGPHYSSPLLAEIDGTRQVIDWNERALVGVDSKTGRKLWEAPAKGDFTDQNMPTPVLHRGQILLGAENRGIRCLAPRREEGTWTVDQRWHQEEVALNMSTAVMNGDLLYGFSHYDLGRIFCLDPETGKVLWKGPPRTGDHVTFLAMPGHILALINTGELRILEATGKGYNRLASWRVAKDRTYAPPVLLKDGILVKDEETLTRWSLDAKAARPPARHDSKGPAPAFRAVLHPKNLA